MADDWAPVSDGPAPVATAAPTAKHDADDDWKPVTPSPVSRLMTSQLAQPPSNRWDFSGDIGRGVGSGIAAVKQDVSQALAPPTAENSGYMGSAGRIGSAAMAPVHALGALTAPVTEPIMTALSSAYSYLPFAGAYQRAGSPGIFNPNPAQRPDISPQDAARGDIGLAMMAMRPGANPTVAGAPTPPAAAPGPVPGGAMPNVPVNSLSPSSMASAAGTVRPGYAPRLNVLSPEAMAEAGTTSAAPNSAVREIVARLEQDAKGGGLTPEQILAERAKTPGVPLSLADLGGENTRGLLGNVARAPGEGRQIVKTETAARDLAAPVRLRQSLDAALGDGSAYEAGTSLMAQRKTAAAPLYERFEGAAPMSPDAVAPEGSIGRLMDRTSMKQAMKNAVDIAREEGIDAKTLGITVNEAGDPQFVKVPTWRTMDLVKRGIDDVVEANRDPVTGRLTLDNKGRAINGTRAELIQAIDTMNPAYAQAREAWAGPSESLDVIRFGRDALKNEPEANAARLAQMSPADQEFARIGLKAKLVDLMESAGASADEARKIVASEGMRRKIMPFFPNEAVATQFLDNVAAESRIFRTNYDLIGNSKTAGRQAEDVNSLFDAVGSALHTGVQAMHGNYFNVVRGVRNTLGALGDLRRNPEINAEIARLMFEPIIGGDQPSGSMKLLQNWMSYKNAQAAQAAQRASTQQNFMRQYAQQPQGIVPQPPPGPQSP